MKMRNRLSAAAASMLCLTMLLTACGGDGGSSQNASASQESSAAASSTGETVNTAGGKSGESDGAKEEKTAKSGGVLKVGTGQSPTVIGFTPEITNNSFQQFLRTSFNSLTFYDEKGNLAPELATSWETDADAATITFHLREGVKFHDGTDFNAEAVKWNIEKYKEKGRTEVADVASIECPDAYTVVITLDAWRSSALESIGFFVYYMSPTAFEENGGEDWARGNAVGTGPFIEKAFTQGVSVKYEKNADYWDGAPYLDGVEFSIIAEPTTLENALTAGEIDMISYASIDTVKNLDGSSDYVFEINTNGVGVETTGIIPGSADENDPFYDAKVRQAMCYAIDTETITQALGYGYYTTTNQWAAPGAITYNEDVDGYPYNPEKAKELLAEAGYADGFDTTLWTPNGMQNWATAIADQLTQVGIRTQVEMVDATKGNDLMSNGWEGIYWHFASVSPDLGLYMGRHLDPSGAYYAKGISHPQDCLDLLADIRTAKDDETKVQYEMDLQKKIYDEYALFGKPLYVNAMYAIKAPYVQDDHFTYYHAATWTPAKAWLDQ